MRCPAIVSTIALSAGTALFAAQAQKGGHPSTNVSFVTCPVFRNTAPECWIARHGGRTYFIDPGTGFRPQLGYRVLVEGKATEAPTVCGGIVLDPIHVSVLPIPDKSCESVLPADGVSPPPMGNLYGYSPRKGDAPLAAYVPGAPIAAPPPPYGKRRYTVLFSFDRAFLPEGFTEVIVQQAAVYAIASHAKRVAVTGYSATSLPDNGRKMVESASIAETRAKLVAHALTALGVPSGAIDVKWVPEPAPGNGVDDADRRKVSIEISP